MKILLVLALVLILSACTTQTESNTETRTVTDVWGREVQIPIEVESIIALGPGAPRIAAYLNVIDMLIGAEDSDINNFVVLRDYNPVHHETLRQLPSVGAGGGSGNNNAHPEEIIIIAPDVILAAFTPEAAEELQSQTNIPVVAVRYISTGLANETFFAATRVFAEVVGAEERAEEILTFIDDARADLNNRTVNVLESDKLRVYAGAITFNGQRGFGGTYSNFGPLDAINAFNVANNEDEEGFYEVDFEKIVVWDPDVIFLDPGNMHLVNYEYNTNPSFFHSLRAVQEGRVYAMPAFNFAATNVTYALMNAYFAGSILFPYEFADIDIAEKSAEILMFFLGENTFDVMAEHGLFYGHLVIGE